MTERLVVAVLFLLFWGGSASAQSDYAPLEPLPLGGVLLTLPSGHVSAAGTWEVRFTHRFGEIDGENTFFGLDAGATVGMGVGWVPRRDLELFVARTDVLDTVELSAKYVVVQQAPAIPLSLSVRAGVDWRTEDSVEDETSLFVQAILARKLSSRIEIFVLPTWVSDAGRYPTEEGSIATFSDAANVPLGLAVDLGRGLTAIAELVPPNRDLPGESSDFGWSAGMKKAIGGHHFELILTNSPATTVDQYVTSTFQGTPLDSGDVHLGFNIERQFGRGRR